MASDSPPLDCTEIGGVRVFSVRPPQLLTDVAEAITRQSEATLDQPGPKHVVLNLERVQYISSAGVSTLVALLKRVKANDGRLVVCGITPPVLAILRLCQLLPQDTGRGSAVLASAPDVTAAVQRLTEPA